MATHSPKFSPKWKAEVPACQTYAMSRPHSFEVSTNTDAVDCKRCRKALGLPPLAFKIPVGAHSEKALATIAQMGTRPEQWRLAEIKWTREMCKVLEDVTCPDCCGWRSVLKDEEGKVIPPPPIIPYGELGSSAREMERADHFRRARALGGANGNCERCKGRNPRARNYGYSTGKIQGLVDREMMVGRPVWPKGVVFDSRFSAHDCELCGKTIPSAERVPVHTVGGDQPHGMWVGTDCGRKIFGIELKLKADQKIGK